MTRRVSVNSLGQEQNDIAIPPSIDADGERIAFGSFASNLLPGTTVRGRSQVYVRDLGTMATGLVSAAPNGAPGNNSVPDVPPSISADGRTVNAWHVTDAGTRDEYTDGPLEWVTTERPDRRQKSKDWGHSTLIFKVPYVWELP